MVLPAFVGGLPGGMELVILVVNVVLVAAVAYVIFGVVRALDGPSPNELEDRVANLEGQVEALREELTEREE
jgi:hypothetical protein